MIRVKFWNFLFHDRKEVLCDTIETNEDGDLLFMVKDEMIDSAFPVTVRIIECVEDKKYERENN